MQNWDRPSVPDAIRSIITGNQPIYLCLKMGLINYTALAARIRPEVENLVGDAVNLNTIVVAIKRYVDSMEKMQSREERSEVLKAARMSLTGGIINVGFHPINRFDDYVSDILHKLFDFDPQFRLVQSESFMRIFADDVEGVRKLFTDMANRFDVDIREGFAKISIKLPIEADDKLEVVSLISDVLYRNGVSLRDALFGHDEILLVVDESVAAKAYDLLRKIFG